MRRLALCLALLLAVSTVASCGSSSPKPAPSHSLGTIDGIVLMSNRIAQTAPPTPSPLPGGFGSISGGWFLSAKTRVSVRAMSGSKAGQVVARVPSDAQGLFAVQLVPGRYKVYVMCGAVPCGMNLVAVHPGVTTRVKLILP